MKRSYLLVFVTLVAMTNLSLLSADEIEIGNLRYAINDSTRSAAVVDLLSYSRNGYFGYPSVITIPDTIHYHDTAYPVTEIRQGAFTGRDRYSCITLPKTISRIDKGSFNKYSDIDTIRFSGSLDDWLAKEWNPHIVSRSYDLYIGQELLTSLVIPEGTDTIKANAFAGCRHLTSVTIPTSVRYIGDDAFQGIMNIIYHGDLKSYDNWGARWRNAYVDGYLVYYNDSRKTLLKCLEDAPCIVTIPDGVKRIDEDAFSECEFVRSVTIPNSVEDIGEDAFLEIFNIEYHGKAEGCPWGAYHMNYYAEDNLIYKDKTKKEIIFCAPIVADTIRIPNSVTKIRPFAFAGCGHIGVLYVGNGMRKIGKEVFFMEGAIDSVILSDGVQYIDDKAFRDVRTMVLGASVKQLGKNWIDGECEKIYSYAQSVPKVKGSYGFDYDRVKLYVPDHMADWYSQSYYWRQFDIRTLDTILVDKRHRCKYDFIETKDGIGLISLATGDTLFRPIYQYINYTDRNIVVVDQDDHASAYNRHKVCMIPASRGYADIVPEGINCTAWVCYKLDDDGEEYVYAVCNWKGEEIFLPKGKYSYLVPHYFKKRVFYTVKDKDTEKTFLIDSDEKNYNVKNFPESTKFKYVISLRKYKRDDNDEDYEDDEDDDYYKYYNRFTIDFIPESPNPYPIKDYNKIKNL